MKAEFLNEFLERFNTFPYWIRFYSKNGKDVYCEIETISSVYYFKNAVRISASTKCIYDRKKDIFYYYNVIYGDVSKNNLLRDQAELITPKFSLKDNLINKLNDLMYKIKKLGWCL